jgi:hypothetical protein
MLVRHGVPLTPFKARLFDMIERVTQGRGGIGSDELVSVFYSGQSRSRAMQCVRSHISQINDLFVETDIRIVGNGARPTVYRVESARGALRR